MEQPVNQYGSTRRIVTVDGNEAAASVAHRVSEVIAIYPITPSSAMSQERIPNPQIYERANYIMMLQTWERT